MTEPAGEIPANSGNIQERLCDALSDCVAVLLGEISGIAQKEGVIREAVDALEAADEIERLNNECSASMTEIGNLRAEIEAVRREVAAERKIAEGWQELYDKVVRRLQAASAALTGKP